MKRIFFLIFLLPLFTKAQKPFFSLTAGIDNSRELRMGFNAQAGAGFRVAGPLRLGAGIGVVNFPEAPGAFIPVSGKVDFIFDDVKGIVPVLFFEPGYIVNNVYGSAGTHNRDMKLAGRFTYQAGVGCKLPNKGKATSFLTIGYSSYGFATNAGETESLPGTKNYEAFAVRVGFIL